MNKYRKFVGIFLCIELILIAISNVLFFIMAHINEPEIRRTQETTGTIYKVIYTQTDHKTLILMNVGMGIMFLLSVFLVMYIGKKILKPFHRMMSLTEELEDVKEYRKENVVFGNKSNLTDTNGNALEARNATVYQAIEDSKLKFFNSKNEKITSIEPGHAYATGDFLQKNDLQPGDKIMITYGNVKLSVILDGEAKDALLGSSMMGNNRFLLSKKDEGKLAEDTAEGVQQGKIYYIDLKSGADESTLLYAISGMDRVTSGQVIFDGKDITALPQMKLWMNL